MILLFVLMGGIVASGRVSDAAAEILLRIWIVGVLPLFIGAALIFNGLFISKRGASSLPAHEPGGGTKELEAPLSENYLPAADTNDLVSSVPYSVTDPTTRLLEKEPRERD
ncbi:MAG: hypothetical protein DMF63_01320 [Acidobacteria bacterium]|nr:MAG: hypothetical protein DMF63_01320 [Acidobacteriota bacterium]